jgi:hypothetical protein
MRRWFVGAIGAVVVAGALGVLDLGATIAGQTQSRAYRAPRTADGRPDLNGIWQILNTANYDIQPHAARPAMAVRPAPPRTGSAGLVRATPADLPVPALLPRGGVGGVPALEGFFGASCVRVAVLLPSYFFLLRCPHLL